ncbi:TPA: hypothetical protein ACHWKL_001075 [Providencia stuartii]|uniref:hypothetical protein n=2 Tax=Providencia stuartii TaxID=588 RepID=UPI00113FD205|nr:MULTISPECIES: hypothetical protein [Providencia]MBN5560878.1 hypothetical protein [Providencia stuartii]MBN5599311.1 hypothetical protein [Providencia stuartii]MBN5603633.1 hypothetical protein [Providencia stuartii]MCL8323844.1 hypothetical protein [Providencia thailandensis]QUC27709.1 hypothetical protein JY390_10730 [Providencia stuartii]
MPRKKNNRKKNNKKKSSNKTMFFPEYYQLVWSEIHDKYEDEIREAYVVGSKGFLRDILMPVKNEFNTSNNSVKYNILRDACIKVEAEFERVLSKHSVFYWLHIYRRIAPYLAQDIGNNTDEETVIVVRSHLDQAIYKFGELSKNDDYSLSSDVEFNDILGGMLYDSMRKHLPKSTVDFYACKIKEEKQWVLTSFSEQSIIDIYYLEGIAYQYWYLLAKMRAIGKNISSMIDDFGVINEFRTDEQKFLIESFDRRNSENSPSFGMTSNVGTFIPSQIDDVNNTIFCAMMNSMRYELSSFGFQGLNEKFSPNFIPFFINGNSFYDSHKYLERKFANKFNFGLLEFCQLIKILSNISLSSDRFLKIKNVSEDFRELMFIYNNFQRGYKIYSICRSELKSSIIEIYDNLKAKESIRKSSLDSQLDDILDFIILKEGGQKNIGIWSNGPKPILIESCGNYILEYSSIYYIFKNLFFGLRNYDSKNKKGFEFEDSLCDLLKMEGFDVILNSSIIKIGDNKREVDVGVRLNNKLYLFECKCFERPLNFDIGDPDTIKYRVEELDKKLAQADTLVDFITNNIKGDNYDFSWATDISSYVVSSYTEWIWSKEKRLWSKNPTIPRIVSVYEALKLLKLDKNS